MTNPLYIEKTKFKAYHLVLANKMKDLDDDVLIDTVDGMTNLSEMLAEITRSRLDDLSLCDALRTRIRDMQERLTRISGRADTKQRIVSNTMEDVGLSKVVEPDFTLSLRKQPPKLQVTDETTVPSEFWRQQAPKLDRQTLIAALKAGEKIAGALLNNGGVTISVRTK
jgi:Siphovirus Gp157